ncbi:ABC-2 type transporter [Pyrolobus fumarii 1A]|uniref:ABC-2 type transporter n=1 Tax=Pyrolobus fumarii (strain DSM 11204 / 1A) TaxID=694429 RepID=G0ECX9_PYRF1|nr:ABC-2 type transporter [Pyrolobus fumarii]AEM39699.1 ABC-2 type transporter [Pyrolobus fumarii 1A]
MRLGRIAALIWKDLVLDARRLSEAGSMLIFVAAASVLTSYVVREGGTAQASVVGLLAVMLFLAVYTALSSFIREAERGTLDGLRVSPALPEELYTAKLLYSFMLLAGTSIAYSLLYAFFSQDYSLLRLETLQLTLAVSLYTASASSLASSILVYSEARAFLLPVTIVVLVLPFLQGVTPLVLDAARGVTVSTSSVIGMAVSALGFTMLTVWLSRYALEAV